MEKKFLQSLQKYLTVNNKSKRELPGFPCYYRKLQYVDGSHDHRNDASDPAHEGCQGLTGIHCIRPQNEKWNARMRYE